MIECHSSYSAYFACRFTPFHVLVIIPKAFIFCRFEAQYEITWPLKYPLRYDFPQYIVNYFSLPDLLQKIP